MSETLLQQIEGHRIFYEDLQVGDRFVTARRTITETDIVNFAGLSGDFNPLHVDAVSAGASMHGERIAHGLLVLSIASGLCTRLPLLKFIEPTVLGLVNLECQFRKPCRIGDTIHVVLTIKEKVASIQGDRGTVVMRRVAINQHDEEVMDSVWRIKIRARDRTECIPNEVG